MKEGIPYLASVGVIWDTANLNVLFDWASKTSLFRVRVSHFLQNAGEYGMPSFAEEFTGLVSYLASG
jgi:hypothetical protein